MPLTRAEFPVALGLYGLLSQKALVGVTVKTCGSGDAQCAAPFETAVTDANGFVTFSKVPSSSDGFDGYFDLSGGPSYPQLVYFRFPRLVQASTFGIDALEANDVKMLAAALGLVADPTRGSFYGRIRDCQQQQAGGVSLTVNDPSALPFYTADGAPSITAAQTDPRDGLAGAFNVLVGPREFKATLVGTGQSVQSTTVFIRAGAVTSMDLSP